MHVWHVRCIERPRERQTGESKENRVDRVDLFWPYLPFQLNTENTPNVDKPKQKIRKPWMATLVMKKLWKVGVEGQTQHVLSDVSDISKTYHDSPARNSNGRDGMGWYGGSWPQLHQKRVYKGFHDYLLSTSK
jgi:hypothetical protein